MSIKRLLLSLLTLMVGSAVLMPIAPSVTFAGSDSVEPGRRQSVDAKQAVQYLITDDAQSPGDSHSATASGQPAQTLTTLESSLNGGGVTAATSGVWSMGGSVGQSVAGNSTTGTWELISGFWTQSESSTPPPCAVVKTGDVNVSTTLTSADIIYLVNYVFKSLAAPLPCAAAGDVNCSGSVTSADIIYMVNHVFKSQAAPCNVCDLIADGTWTCP